MAQPSFPLPDYLKAQEALFRAATRQLQSKSNSPIALRGRRVAAG